MLLFDLRLGVGFEILEGRYEFHALLFVLKGSTIEAYELPQFGGYPAGVGVVDTEFLEHLVEFGGAGDSGFVVGVAFIDNKRDCVLFTLYQNFCLFLVDCGNSLFQPVLRCRENTGYVRTYGGFLIQHFASHALAVNYHDRLFARVVFDCEIDFAILIHCCKD